MWRLLIVTLPTQPSAVRLRIWRAIKSLGCGALRDGAYLLPADRAAPLEPLAVEVRAHGGSAAILALNARDEAQQRELIQLFDRGDAFAHWQVTADELSKQLPKLAEADARRRLRSVTEALLALQRIDYFPGPAAAQAQAGLSDLRLALEARHARGEPQPRAGAVRPRDPRKYQGRRWATRARPWVDRLACAWLIRRFIDAEPQFVWLKPGAKPPRGALGFDFDGADFSHVDSMVSFEVMLAAFGLAGDAALRKVGALVHFLDIGGIPVPQAPGVEAILEGLRSLHSDDDALLAASDAVFDALHATNRTSL